MHGTMNIKFYKLCDFWQKYFILSQLALLVCIACFWAKQPHDTKILKLLGIFNQTRHFQNQEISVSPIRVVNIAPSNELLSFSFSFCNIQISFYFVCCVFCVCGWVCVCVCVCVCVRACVRARECILFSPSVTLKCMTKRHIWTDFNMEFFEIKSFTTTNMPSHS